MVQTDRDLFHFLCQSMQVLEKMNVLIGLQCGDGGSGGVMDLADILNSLIEAGLGQDSGGKRDSAALTKKQKLKQCHAES